jgi:hypothetical protein
MTLALPTSQATRSAAMHSDQESSITADNDPAVDDKPASIDLSRGLGRANIPLGADARGHRGCDRLPTV